MSVYARTSHRRFVRDADRAKLAGVCAGLADYFGFNLCVTRVLFIIALCVAFPFALIGYIAMVLLFPAESGRETYVVEREVRVRRRRMSRKERRRAAEEERQQTIDEYEDRRRSLDARLAKIEKYVTSSRYTLDNEFWDL